MSEPTTNKQQPEEPPLLTSTQVAVRMGMSESTIRKMRVDGKGPRYFKIGNRVRYHAFAVDQFLAEAMRQSTKEAAS